MREPRLGDDIDDFCVRCKRIMNHAVVSVLNAEPAKVRCRTCYNDHDYRHEQPPPPKVDARKAALFIEVLKKVNPDATGPVVEEPDGLPDPDPLDDGDSEADAAESEPEIAAEAAVVEAPAPVRIPKAKAKAKPKPKTTGKSRR
ncbi:MAG: hypothetical protein ACLQVN_09380 [Bryobacteraceae bacterium]